MSVPGWSWLGGLAGAIFVTAGVLLVPRIGAAGFLVGTVVGQLILAVVIDHNGWMGVHNIPMDSKRACGLAFVLLGALLFGLSKR